MRARDESVLAEGDAATAVAADVGHDVADLVVVAGATALAGGGGRYLVFFARHFEVVWWFVWMVDGGGLVVKEKIGGALGVRAVMGKFGRQNLGGEEVLWVRTSLSDQPSHG